jgi:hypothetical protein
MHYDADISENLNGTLLFNSIINPSHSKETVLLVYT